MVIINGILCFYKCSREMLHLWTLCSYVRRIKLVSFQQQPLLGTLRIWYRIIHLVKSWGTKESRKYAFQWYSKSVLKINTENNGLTLIFDLACVYILLPQTTCCLSRSNDSWSFSTSSQELSCFLQSRISRCIIRCTQKLHSSCKLTLLYTNKSSQVQRSLTQNGSLGL